MNIEYFNVLIILSFGYFFRGDEDSDDYNKYLWYEGEGVYIFQYTLEMPI